MTPYRTEALLLDEMFSPVLSEALRAEGFDVVAVAGHALLAASPDRDVAAWAVKEQRRVVTENVRDFVPLPASESTLCVLLTSSRRFPRSRTNVGPLLEALRSWLRAETERSPMEWL